MPVLNLLLILLSSTLYAFQSEVYQSVKDIPNPKTENGRYISDPQGVLTGSELDSLNVLLEKLDQKTGVEAAVVIINDFNANQDDFTFATDLFRYWGIGKRQADNGLLLFISINRRQYRFITGYGVEGLLPDADLKIIGQQTLVPAFKQQSYGAGIIKTMQIIVQYLQQPANKKELNSLLNKPMSQRSVQQSAEVSTKTVTLIIALLLWAVAIWQIQKFKSTIPQATKRNANLYSDVAAWVTIVLVGFVVLIGIILFFAGHVMNALSAILKAFSTLCYLVIALYLFFAHLNVLSRLRKHYQDDVNFTTAVKQFYKQTWWHLLLSPLALVFLVIEWLRAKRVQARVVPQVDDKGNEMQRLNRDEPTQTEDYLSAGQIKEEQMGSMVYDIWTSSQESKPKLVAHPGYEYDDFDVCPKCGFRTLTKPIEITTKRATYTHGGEAKRVNLCRYCNHENFIETIALAQLVKSTNSSSSSSSSSSSGSSSSSSSGSWGGGSTGGGGAGGSW